MTILFLSLDELREIAKDFKDDLQRQANQGIRKKDWEQGIGSLASMEAVGELVRLCEQRAGQFSPERAEERAKLLPAKKQKRVHELPAAVPIVRKRIAGGER